MAKDGVNVVWFQIQMTNGLRRIYSLTYNVLQIPEEGDLGTQNFQLTMNLNRSTTLDITTKPPFLGMCCYALLFFANSNL